MFPCIIIHFGEQDKYRVSSYKMLPLGNVTNDRKMTFEAIIRLHQSPP